MNEETPNFEKDWNELRQVVTPQSIIIFAEKLGVDAMALCMLDCHWSIEDKAWAFPIKDSRMNIVGIRLIAENGNQWVVKGSSGGLFIPNDVNHCESIIFVQGPIQCAKFISSGKAAIGFDYDKEDMAKEFIRGNNIKNAMIVVDELYKII